LNSALPEAADLRLRSGRLEILQTLLASWQPYALAQSWKLPGGYDAGVKVLKKKGARIEIDELEHATFTSESYENEGSKSGLSNVGAAQHAPSLVRPGGRRAR
jgi:hypothetical protein